ncbi:hypothetical protein XYCOK13_39240 [Xylanibacillus composti]|uniref:Uncharacterized protein n=1 Tax=Xylanibacillus composti TaxID=1572762 RepID=A0A8J4M3Q3_9BACL|nr:hypothetical protein XYCOK13_39240 [Xylanibacillus composti]
MARHGYPRRVLHAASVLYGPVTFLRWYDPDQVQGLKAFPAFSQPKHLWAPLATNANYEVPFYHNTRCGEMQEP